MTAKKKNVSVQTAPNGNELRLKIEKLAYELWQADGSPHGNDLHYWLLAEHDLTKLYGISAGIHRTAIQ
jgi:hypothetical protein